MAIAKELNQKYLLNVKETMQYTGLGENTVRDMLNYPGSTFTVKVGNRLYANRKLLEKYLDNLTKAW